MTIEKLVQDVLAWAEARNFFGEGGANTETQYLKLFEELGELAADMARGRCPKDSIGDSLVVAIIICRLKWLSFLEIYNDDYTDDKDIYDATHAYMVALNYAAQAAEHRGMKGEIYYLGLFLTSLDVLAAWLGVDTLRALSLGYNEIKDRKGQFVNGTFIKESDMQDPKQLKMQI